MKHNFIFKAAILIALLVFLAGTPYKVYADVQENIVTTEDGYADKQNDNVSGETDTNEIDNLETPEKIDSEENTVDEKKTEKEDKVTTENATENWRNLNWPIAVIAVLLTVLSEIKKQRDCFSVKNMRTGGKSIKSDMRSMKDLYKSVQQYGKRLERYLFNMRAKD